MKIKVSIPCLIVFGLLLLSGFQRGQQVILTNAKQVSYLYYGAGCAGTSTNTCATTGTMLATSNAFQYGSPIATGSTLAASTTYYMEYQVSTTNTSRVYNTGATTDYHVATYGTWGSSLTWSTLANELFNSYIRVTAN